MKWAAFLVSFVTVSGWAMALPMPGRCFILPEIPVTHYLCGSDTELTPPQPKAMNLDSAYPEDIDAFR